jgi:hypothetical protein
MPVNFSNSVASDELEILQVGEQSSGRLANLQAVLLVAYNSVSMVCYEKAWQSFYGICN